jgi:ferredoxin
MTYVVTQACADVKDRSCVDQRPVDCIYEGEPFLEINAQFFAGISSPAGAGKLGRPGRDHRFVASLPHAGRP